MKRVLVVLGLAATLVGAVACGAPTVGQPTPATTNGGGQTSQDGPSPTSTASGGGGNSLPVDHPCDLVPTSGLERVGVSGQPSETSVGTAPACEFDTNDFTIDVEILTTLGLSDFQAAGGTVQTTTVGSHDAKEVTDNTGSCVIGIGVTAKSRVDVTVTPISGGNPCPTAMTLAQMIEPKLP